MIFLYVFLEIPAQGHLQLMEIHNRSYTAAAQRTKDQVAAAPEEAAFLSRPASAMRTVLTSDGGRGTGARSVQRPAAAP